MRLPGSSYKIDCVCTLTKRAVKEGNSVVITINFIETGKLICKKLQEEGVKSSYIFGLQSQKEKLENEREFKSGETQVMIIQLRSGGLGFDFKNANVVILAEEDYSPKVNEQACHRVVRLVQKKKCFIYFVYTRNTIDEKILFGILKTKEQLIDSIVETINT